jgi:hypothetical protein
MKQFINWGGLTPDQLQARKQLEIQEYLQSKYLKEALARQSSSPVSAVSGGGVSASTISFTVDTADGTDFGMSFNTTGPIEFTIDWGDGTTHVDDGAGGYYEESHDYPDSNAVYTASITFSDPLSVTELNFYGND